MLLRLYRSRNLALSSLQRRRLGWSVLAMWVLLFAALPNGPHWGWPFAWLQNGTTWPAPGIEEQRILHGRFWRGVLDTVVWDEPLFIVTYHQWSQAGLNTLRVRPVALFFNVCVAGMIALPLILVMHRRLKQLCVARGCCPQCAYDLRGSASRCPECGTPVTTTNN
jgi:hypothetical protein